MTFTEEQLRELALQLSKPHGKNGVEISNIMNDSNFGMTKSTINALSIATNDRVLELGHGNGKHIKELINQAEDVFYYGLEISELMKQEAEKQNFNNTSFHLYDGQCIPFEDKFFDKIMTVNTIYFWQNPMLLLNEIYRVLKNDGICCIGFAKKEFMQTLPFTKFGFNLYDDKRLMELINQAPFKICGIKDYQEKVKSKGNEIIDRPYGVAVIKK